MGRALRAARGGYVYHVLNRANARLPLFESDADYEAFERILADGVARFRPRLLAYCLMPNHWHLLVHPREDDALSKFVGWVTLTHTQRLHAFRGTTGCGHIYQGRFKSFPVQDDDHFYTVCRYVERNALRAELVKSAETWRFGSLSRMTQGDATAKELLSSWPVPRPRNWTALVNRPQSEADLAAVRRAIARGNPLGDEKWTRRTAAKLDLQSTLRPRGRPKKGS
jgi:putative transposase